ncbi:MAG: SET domain-containing protein [Acidobacteria bacterium]|nr:SET domain-containing protein [Acidobacteriota bacterium]
MNMDNQPSILETPSRATSADIEARKQLMRQKLSWISPKAETRDTGKYGYGVFAIESFAKDERIALLGGHILTLKELMTLGGKSQEMAYQIGDDLFSAYVTEEELRGWRSGLAGDYFNNSCVPNAGFRGMIEVVAMREIEAGKQITFNYAMCSKQSFDDIDCL